ncbi:hypothetical protein HDU87_003397 [Geranomyces variabilis]|uniref:Uncharacterized protein n=1 Tax=Geranomyces variabilis TaxID=109894 RepID=A0AAD5XN30_9FUNG|nr:hypothetical protein HDU87_003397 [Geranomyces variabilis]
MTEYMETAPAPATPAGQLRPVARQYVMVAQPVIMALIARLARTVDWVGENATRLRAIAFVNTDTELASMESLATLAPPGITETLLAHASVTQSYLAGGDDILVPANLTGKLVTNSLLAWMQHLPRW